MLKGKQILAIGLIIFSISLLIRNIFLIESHIIEFTSGLGVGLEIVGFIVQYKEEKK